MNLGLVVSMYDEEQCVARNLAKHKFAQVAIVQSRLEPYPSIQAQIRTVGHYIRFPNLDTRTDEEKAANAERFDVGARSMSRNFAAGFGKMGGLDYVVAITGDTLFLHLYGIQWIIGTMEKRGAQIGCSRAMGQNLHAAHWTREQMADKSLRKEGRLQDDSVKDFMPQLWIARGDMIERLQHIEVTNPWCMEQCLGDAIGDASQFVFSETAYGFSDGVIYHTPSPEGWQHGR